MYRDNPLLLQEHYIKVFLPHRFPLFFSFIVINYYYLLKKVNVRKKGRRTAGQLEYFPCNLLVSLALTFRFFYFPFWVSLLFIFMWRVFPFVIENFLAYQKRDRILLAIQRREGFLLAYRWENEPDCSVCVVLWFLHIHTTIPVSTGDFKFLFDYVNLTINK
jgi:hypothetical protein